jgi:hypothetical protein
MVSSIIRLGLTTAWCRSSGVSQSVPTGRAEREMPVGVVERGRE